jgi:hypothetical protein
MQMPCTILSVNAVTQALDSNIGSAGMMVGLVVLDAIETCSRRTRSDPSVQSLLSIRHNAEYSVS